jgi:hypothetical protein
VGDDLLVHLEDLDPVEDSLPDRDLVDVADPGVVIRAELIASDAHPVVVDTPFGIETAPTIVPSWPLPLVSSALPSSGQWPTNPDNRIAGSAEVPAAPAATNGIVAASAIPQATGTMMDRRRQPIRARRDGVCVVIRTSLFRAATDARRKQRAPRCQRLRTYKKIAAPGSVPMPKVTTRRQRPSPIQEGAAMEPISDGVVCLSCRRFRPPERLRRECPYCGYLGWAYRSKLSENDRRWYSKHKIGDRG